MLSRVGAADLPPGDRRQEVERGDCGPGCQERRHPERCHRDQRDERCERQVEHRPPRRACKLLVPAALGLRRRLRDDCQLEVPLRSNSFELFVQTAMTCLPQPCFRVSRWGLLVSPATATEQYNQPMDTITVASIAYRPEGDVAPQCGLRRKSERSQSVGDTWSAHMTSSLPGGPGRARAAEAGGRSGYGVEGPRLGSHVGRAKDRRTPPIEETLGRVRPGFSATSPLRSVPGHSPPVVRRGTGESRCSRSVRANRPTVTYLT